MTKKFIVKVYAKDSFAFWTLSGSTPNMEQGYVFTEETVPPFFKPMLTLPYIEKIYLEDEA